MALFVVDGDYENVYVLAYTHIPDHSRLVQEPPTTPLSRKISEDLILRNDRFYSDLAICVTDVTSCQARPHPHNQYLEDVAAGQYR
ncbi:hypothetical protein J6590_046861 [Homalodisca vitripennis]|nr:hypothetical protein J6590_046861 [Homalodisca vitripennis]